MGAPHTCSNGGYVVSPTGFRGFSKEAGKAMRRAKTQIYFVLIFEKPTCMNMQPGVLANKFRNHTTGAFQQLQKICKMPRLETGYIPGYKSFYPFSSKSLASPNKSRTFVPTNPTTLLVARPMDQGGTFLLIWNIPSSPSPSLNR